MVEKQPIFLKNRNCNEEKSRKGKTLDWKIYILHGLPDPGIRIICYCISFLVPTIHQRVGQFQVQLRTSGPAMRPKTISPPIWAQRQPISRTGDYKRPGNFHHETNLLSPVKLSCVFRLPSPDTPKARSAGPLARRWRSRQPAFATAPVPRLLRSARAHCASATE